MTTRVLAILAAAAVLSAVGSAWLLHGRRRADRAMERLDAGSRESDALASWASAVRQAPAERRPALVRERFDQSVAEPERDARAVQIVPALMWAESHVPASVHASPQGAVRATWICRSGAPCGPQLALLFCRAPGGALRLLGPMP